MGVAVAATRANSRMHSFCPCPSPIRAACLPACLQAGLGQLLSRPATPGALGATTDWLCFVAGALCRLAVRGWRLTGVRAQPSRLHPPVMLGWPPTHIPPLLSLRRAAPLCLCLHSVPPAACGGYSAAGGSCGP